MKTEIFETLLEKLKRDTSDTDLDLGMRSKWRDYELNVYCVDSEMTIEATFCDKEIVLKENQIKKIEKIFSVELQEVNNAFVMSKKNDFIDPYEYTGFTDSYESTGHKPSDFY